MNDVKFVKHFKVYSYIKYLKCNYKLNEVKLKEFNKKIKRNQLKILKFNFKGM